MRTAIILGDSPDFDSKVIRRIISIKHAATAALEPALTAAWHAVWLTVKHAVILAALAACKATNTPTLNCALATDFAAIAAAVFKNMSAVDIAHVIIVNILCSFVFKKMRCKVTF